MRFYPKAKPVSAHRRLLELSRSGYIQTIASYTGNGFVWTLTDKGFGIVKEKVGDLKQSGYKCEAIGHDLLSMAAMVGEWIHETPRGVEFYSEQQLRRKDISQHPMWVPQSEIHRSDGYWRLPKLPRGSSVSLEIERSQKDLRKYELIADFYEEFHFVRHVVWIAPVFKQRSSIEATMREYLRQEQTKHSFISIDDFVRLGWQAKFQIGKLSGRTLSEFMSASSAPSQRLGDSRFLLETRKKPLKFDTSKILETHGFFN
jgi:hypothetical protein